jgi:hypothetical protein
MDFYADNAAEQLQKFAFNRRKAKRMGVPVYLLKGAKTSRFIAYVRWSRDCDGMEGEHIIFLPATLEALQAHIDHESEWADGPFSFTPVPLHDAVEFEGWSRDTYAEAAGY